MISSLSRDQVREVDRRAIEEYGLPGVVLMENAGRGAAELLLSRQVRGPVVICCGRGNNGGDGFVIARHLELAGCDVRILLLADPAGLTGDAAINLGVIQRSGVPLEVLPNPTADELDRGLSNAEWIVDALLGTGTRGTLREPFVTAIAAINRSGRRVFAVDLPSGLDADTGLPLGECVRAELTATFVASKSGFEAPTAREYLGDVHTVGIGAPRRLLSEFGL